jgi:general secretion pathway protein A
MYESFFGLREPPFSLTPDPRFLWLSETHEEGLAALYYGITRRKGFLLLTGPVGVGKTTLLRATLDRVPEGIDAALILNTASLDPLDLLKMVAAELQLQGSLETKADYLIALNGFLLERLETGLNAALIIDEAQNLDLATLEEVRLLSNLETDTEKLLQIVLIGQPELRQKLDDPRLRPLRQRIAIDYDIELLRPFEVASYLGHRINVAGAHYEEVFAPGAESAFFAFSSGCPRLLSLLADRVLLAAYSRGLRPVPVALVEAKAKEMSAMQSGLPSRAGEFEA